MESIGGVSWSKFTVEMKKDFIQDNGVTTIPQTMRNGADLRKLIANHLSGSSIITAIASTSAKKKTAAAIPVCVVALGTMFM